MVIHREEIMVEEFGALGFWIFLAALLVGGMWKETRQQAEKHETLRRLVEKTGTIDEAKLKELFSAAPGEQVKPGGGYRALRVTGTIIMFVAAGLGIIFATIGIVFGDRQAIVALGISAATGIAGLGVFFSSRFAEQPPGSQYERKSL
jgi:hypothetical protein